MNKEQINKTALKIKGELQKRIKELSTEDKRGIVIGMANDFSFTVINGIKVKEYDYSKKRPLFEELRAILKKAFEEPYDEELGCFPVASRLFSISGVNKSCNSHILIKKYLK